MKKSYYLLVVGLFLLILALVIVSPVVTTEAAVKKAPPKPTLSQIIAEVSKTFFKNSEMKKEPSKYGGSVPYSHLEESPYLKTLWEGMPFSKDYNEDRGHYYALEDVKSTKRLSPATPMTCMTCKSSNVPAAMKKYGDAYYTLPMLVYQDEFKHSIGCSDCHDLKTYKLVITRPAFVEAMKRRGIDVTKASQSQLRTYVCAQCHVEYFFDPQNGKKLTFPWDKGFDPENIYQYYEERGFADWTNPSTFVKELKAQHPEFEMFQGSTHQKAGATCADCHMPRKTVTSGKLTFTVASHQWTSPLKDMSACKKCHTKDAKFLTERVFYIQDRVKAAIDRAGEANAETLRTIKSVAAGTYDPAILAEAQKLQRESQWYWDYVAAENSIGFHNPSKAFATLNKSIELAYQARLKALEAKK
ncbi:cytochrome c552 [Carboxydothermus islandicus]|uniref:nitrite reductase (cytochrome; ammonia-forming) n=1 Tax=Carboxydothermus islandicus TaxID=661089 RepID=A0A1L8CZN4_9THEO|nr:ammonia-forming cytochrome c nitrite reductase subunit c552 [Carboxydothermus islandicus]GAV24392.1 cytochrome c552 [Carboxydothermus islandicus]